MPLLQGRVGRVIRRKAQAASRCERSKAQGTRVLRNESTGFLSAVWRDFLLWLFLWAEKSAFD